MIITPASFPTPDLIKATNNPGLWDQQDGFAKYQAAAANDSLAWLGTWLDAATTGVERSAAFVQLYRNLAEWRYQLAQWPVGRSPGSQLEEYRRPIAAADPRLSTFGAGLRSEGGGHINHEKRRLTEGAPTPGSRESTRIGAIIQGRFDAEAPDQQVLQNQVTVPDGRIINGNLLLQGLAAANSRGVPYALEGVYVTKTGTQEDRRALQREAFTLLADLEGRRAAGETDLRSDPEARHAFVQAEYFLYQGPEYERGGDATIRTLLVTAHARVFDQALRLPKNIDVMAYVAGQQAFYDHVGRTQTTIAGDAQAAVTQPVVSQAAVTQAAVTQAAVTQGTAASRPKGRSTPLERG